MAIKSVIDIEINDEKFKEFQALFEKYQQSLGKMPGQWGKINKETSSLQGNFNKVQHALDSIASRIDKNYVALGNTNRVVSKAEKHFQNIGKTSANIAKNVSATTWNLLKWGGVTAAFGLLGAASGLFGIGSLAGSVSNNRKQAQGLGVSSGELKAAQINFERYADVNSLLSSVAEAQTDVQKQWAFQAAGVSQSQNVAELLPQLLRKAGEVYKAGDSATAQQRLQVTGLSALGIDVETARRYASLKEDEIDAVERSNRQDQQTFKLQDDLQRKWQDLNVQLGRAGYTIEKTFVEALGGLVTPISKLSDAFSTAVASFLKNPQMGAWLDTFGKKIQEFAEYLQKPEFKKDVTEFMSNVSQLAKSAYDAAVTLGLITPNKVTPEEVSKYKSNYIAQHPNEQEWNEKFYEGKAQNLKNQQLKLMQGSTPEFMSALEKANKEWKSNKELNPSGKPLPITSYARDRAEQQKIYNAWKKAGGDETHPYAGGYYKPVNPMSQENIGREFFHQNKVDIAGKNKEEQAKITEFMKTQDFVADVKDDPVHFRWLKDKLESESTKSKPMLTAPTGNNSSTNFANTLGSLNWNPTPIELSVNTTKIPGQDTNIDILKAGGYYTSIGLR